MKYFAYGSNMLTARLCRRVPGAVPVALGCVLGHERRFHKLGRDLSGKASVVVAGSAARLWGVLFEIAPGEKSTLDRIEGLGRGYRHLELEVRASGDRFRAFSYQAEETHVDESLRPFGWYKDLVVAGAREHRLPPAVLAELERVEWIRDPDAGRARRERSVLRDREVTTLVGF